MQLSENVVPPSPAVAQAYQLRLYVAGQTPKSVLAFKNLKQICEEHAPVPRAGVVERCGGVRSVRRDRFRVDVEHAASRLEPCIPQRPRVAERVQIDGEQVPFRHARRRAWTECQSAIPAATPTASIATSMGEPSRPGTNDWCSSSLIA